MAVNLKSTVAPIVPKGTKSPLRLTASQSIRTDNRLGSNGQKLANDLDSIAATVNALHASAQTSPNVNEIILVNESGQVVAAFGEVVFQGVRYTNYANEIHVGNPQNSVNPSDPTQAVFNANLDGSVTVGGTGWLDVHDEFDGNAAWIGTQNDTLNITNAVNNGSGEIRITVTSHTLITGNSPTVRNMNLVNVPNGNGDWTVTVIDANTIDLQGSIFSGPFQPIVNPPEGLPTYQPTIDRILQISNAVDNGSGLIRIFTSVAHTYESGTAVNIPSPGPVGVPSSVGQWVIKIPDTLMISGAVDNGSGLIRITVPDGNYKTGDRVQVLSVGGVPNADGNWIATAISPTVIDLQGSSFMGVYTSGGTTTFTNANFFDLVDSVFAGSYISGGTVLQYFAGILAETVAVGPSFQNYKLRAFPSGDLRINNAEISLTSASGQIIIDPTTTQIRLTNFSNLSEIVLDATVPSLTFYDQTGTPDVTLEILQEASKAIASATNASPIVLHVPGSATGSVLNGPWLNGDTIYIQGATGNTIINGYRIIENFNVMAETFNITDLQGHILNGNGVFAGAATASRYYAGLLAQSLALGGSWGGYRLRFFADGTLKINNASIDSSTITNTTISGNFSSSTGTAPNVLTLTIANGLLTVSGTGTQAGKGLIVIDQLEITGQTPAPTAPASGKAILYYDTGLGGLYYNLGGAGWVGISGAGPTVFAPTLSFGGASSGITYSVNSGTYVVDSTGMVFGTIQITLTNKGSSTGAAVIAGLPSTPGLQWQASVTSAANMLALTGALSAYAVNGNPSIALLQWGATGTSALADTFFTNTSSIFVTFSYHL